MNRRGFSLIELLVVITIIAAVLGMAAPAGMRFQTTLQRENAKQKLREDIAMARQTAVTRHIPVYMIFGTPPTTTNLASYTVHQDTDASGTWSAGEPRNTYTLPNKVKIDAALAPTDSLVFQTTGILRIGTAGGRLIVKGNSINDTLMVSSAGMTYELK